MKQYKPKKLTTKKFNLNKRESSSSRGYDAEWSKFTFRFKHYNPNCYACSSNQKINVDHIKNKKEFPDLAKAPDNFIPLCQSCHSIITNKFEKNIPMDLEGKLKWINKKREETKTTCRVKVIPYTK